MERRKLLAFVLAFIIGAQVFGFLGSVLSPTADLFLSIEGIDTDLGITTREQKDQLAEASWGPNPTYIRVDPDPIGEEIFTTQLGFDTRQDPLSRAVCRQPDIIVTFTLPKPVVKGDPIPHTTPTGEQYQLYKTVFEVVLKTDADLYSQNSAIGEIAYLVEGQIAGMGVSVTPPFGAVWEGEAYVEYELKNHPNGFIYEAYINKDPRVGAINKDGIYTNMDLEAPAISPIAHAHQESQSALSFYDSIGGNEITDFNAIRTSRGIIPLGGKLGVGADPIIEKHTWPLHDEFKGWNVYNTAIKYQIAVIVAIPEVDTVDENGLPLDPDEILDGSTHEDEIGDPRYFNPDVADAASGLDKLFSGVGSAFGTVNDTIRLLLIAVIVIAVVFILFYVFAALFGARRVTK